MDEPCSSACSNFALKLAGKERRAVAGNQEVKLWVPYGGRMRCPYKVKGPFVNHQLAEEAHHDGFRRETKAGSRRLPVDTPSGGSTPL